jgi:hypothetical protein
MNPEDHFFDFEGLEDEPERAMDTAGRDRRPDTPPIDPPVVRRGPDDAEITGAVDEIDAELYDEDNDDAALMDDEIAARVRRALRMDAATSMLHILVTVEQGMVTLRGRVQTLEDTDNAIDVASRIPNVVDVLDEIDVEE